MTSIQTKNGLQTALTSVIVSASRSTDIPSYYGEWFVNRLKEGYCAWVNPFNQKTSYVSFEKTRAIIFWTKNPAPMMNLLDQIDELGYHYYFQYTLNDYEAEGFEPKMPALSHRIETFKKLSNKIGAERVIWRFDPILLGGNINAREILMRIWRIGKQLKGFTNKLVFSFVDVRAYRKVQNNLIKETEGFYTKDNVFDAEASQQQIHEICEGLVKIRERWKEEGWPITIATCCEDVDLSHYGIEKNHCIDGELLKKLFPDDTALMHYLNTGKELEEQSSELDLFGSSIPSVMKIIPIEKLKDKGQRESCGCIKSKDIGMYNTCMHFCVYCYANVSRKTVIENRKKHNLNGEYLISPAKETNLQEE